GTGTGGPRGPGGVIATEAGELIEPGRVIEPGGAVGPGRVIEPGRAIVIDPAGRQPRGGTIEPGGSATAVAPRGGIEASPGRGQDRPGEPGGARGPPETLFPRGARRP